MLECLKWCLCLCVKKNCVLTFSLIVAKFWLLLSNELFRLSLTTGCIFWKGRAGTKIFFLTQLASQNSVYSKCKINWFDFDSVFKHVWKVLYCFLFKSFLINVLITFQRNLDIMQISKSGNFANVMWAKKAQNILTLFFEHLFVLKPKSPHCETFFFQRRQNDMKVEWKKQAVAIQRNASNKQ